MGTGTEPRGAALDILRAVRTGHPFDRALHHKVPSLSDLDRKLAHEIAAGVLRERTMLDRRITAALAKPRRRLPDDLRDVLRIGVYQLAYLDRVPPYAAVQSTVDLAKAECGTKYAPLVNAVLRRVNDAGPDAQLSTDRNASRGLAERYSHPPWLVERWLVRYGAADTERLLRHNNTRPRLVIQPARWSGAALESALKAAGVPHRAATRGLGYTVTAERVQDLPGYQEGAFIVQDPTQRRLVGYIDAPVGSRVWDACAAPGGKSCVLAQSCSVIASDRSPQRLGRLRDNVQRAAPGVRIAAGDAQFPPVRATEIDVVVVDAPCSATGAMARHPDARWRLSAATITELARRQTDMLAGAASAVREGGLLAYLTCSLEPEENEAQVDRFLDLHVDFTREGPDLFVLPTEGEADGGFGARLRRAV